MISMHTNSFKLPFCYEQSAQKQQPTHRDWMFYDKSRVARSLAFNAKPAYYVVKNPGVIKVLDPFVAKFERAKSRIEMLCNGKEYSKAPNALVLELALSALEYFKQFRTAPALVNATGDESLLFEFFVGQDTYSLDFYNSGEIVYVKKINGKVISAVEVPADDLAAVIKEISHAYAWTHV